jgi:hypothetical protein
MKKPRETQQEAGRRTMLWVYHCMTTPKIHHMAMEHTLLRFSLTCIIDLFYNNKIIGYCSTNEARIPITSHKNGIISINAYGEQQTPCALEELMASDLLDLLIIEINHTLLERPWYKSFVTLLKDQARRRPIPVLCAGI